MERPNIVQTLNGGNSGHRPMFSVIETSSLHHDYKSFTQKNNTRDDCNFSSYLLRTEEPNKSAPQVPSQLLEDTELSIFDAQKYFNETNDHHNNIIKQLNNKKVSSSPSPVVLNNIVKSNNIINNVPPDDDDLSISMQMQHRLSSVSSVEGYTRNYRARSFHATPTASSEASWNSQTGLLSNPPGSIAVSLRNHHHHHPPPPQTTHHHHHHQKKRGWFLLRKCPCSGKKSVQVKDDQLSPRSPRSPPRSPSASVSVSASASAVVDISNTNYQKQSTKSIDHQISIAETISSKSQRSSFTHEFLMQKQEIKKDIPKVQRVSSSSSSSSEENHFASSITTAQHQHNQNNQHRLVGGAGLIRPFGDNISVGFSFPILKQSSQVKLIRLPPPGTSPLEDPPRDSLEVFQPPLSDESILSKSIATAVSQDRRGTYGYAGSPISRVTATEDDVASDASSDLFEIETFSTQTSSYPMYRRRDSLDEAQTFNARRIIATNGGGGGGGIFGRRSVDEPATPSVAPTECYEPSEASIDWSVTTAEGFDRASVTNYSISASEFGDITTMRREVERGGLMMIGDGGGGGGGDVSKRRSGNVGLLSCRHEKAVSVGPQPVKCGGDHQLAERERERWGALALNSTTRHVSSRPPSFNKPPLGTSHSARLSLAFAT